MQGQGELDLGVTPGTVAGVDEAGRGPLAGPVIAAAVILDPDRPVPGLADSKRLSPRRREALDRLIRQRALAWATAAATPAEIDRLNILQASLLAMRRAVMALGVAPDAVWADGNRAPRLAMPVRAVVGGDATVPSISAASILAKVLRDREMEVLGERHPGYGFERHKGYPTREHVAAIARLGVTSEHRRSFGPVREALARAAAPPAG
ncbi:MAG TPA: ribonuclease HII [Gammaproteobacteria bacterium]|nr:ribonuclease HII [Gammaproteobacteria bacterium]